MLDIREVVQHGLSGTGKSTDHLRFEFYTIFRYYWLDDDLRRMLTIGVYG